MKIHQFLFLLSATLGTPAIAQQTKIHYEVEAQAIGTTNGEVPFWMRSNQFGSVPTQGVSGSFIGRIYKEYNAVSTNKFDWGAGFEGRTNVGNNSKLILTEGYIKAKIGVFELKGGRTKDVMGLNSDNSLSTGNWAVSGNALGIPKIEISIPNFYRLPAVDGILSFKGNFAHGWTGKQQLRQKLWIGRDSIVNHPPVSTFFHQKSLYFRLGKEKWNINFTGGFNHQVYWGNEHVFYGEAYDLKNLENFLHVITGKTFENGKIPGSKVGNHLGSIDFGIDTELRSLNLSVYRQFFYEAGALGHLANLKDGLTGISVTNSSSPTANVRWKKFLFEFLYTKNQAGELNSKITPTGDEDYYNNHIYRKGWTYKNQNLGSPFLTSREDARHGQVNDPVDYFINNRVVALHLGGELAIFDSSHQFKLSYSENYGTYRTSAIGSSIGARRDPPQYGVFRKVGQVSAYVTGQKEISKSTRLGYSAAFDKGDLLYNSFGLMLSLSKSF